MIEMRDPITEWSNAIKARIGGIIVIFFMTCFTLCLIAPIFGPFIKDGLKKEYVMHSNYEELAEKDMKSIRIVLWTISIIGWIILGIIVL